MSHCHGTARGKGGLLSRERRPPFDPPRERQGRFNLAPAPLTTKREGPCPSFLDYPPHGTFGKHCVYFGRFCFDGACRGGIAALAAICVLSVDGDYTAPKQDSRAAADDRSTLSRIAGINAALPRAGITFRRQKTCASPRLPIKTLSLGGCKGGCSLSSERE